MCVAWCDVGGARRNPVFVYRRCVHIGREGVYVCRMCAQYVGLVVLNEDPPVANTDSQVSERGGCVVRAPVPAVSGEQEPPAAPTLLPSSIPYVLPSSPIPTEHDLGFSCEQ